ncbi:MAG: hypothetical protein OQL09_00620 [Gammaproteobacteria bacterium]|nr:hypothetical protein [Gammaproteobacteria bacterium]
MIHDSDAEADISDYGLRLGACGWQHQHWQNSFYPGDCPQDWRLGFYANEFTAVLVPAQYWPDDYDVEQWCEDVSSRFRFYLQYPPAVDAHWFARRCKDFGPLLAGVICDVDRDLDLPCPVYVMPNTDQSVKLLKAVNGKAPTLAMIELGHSDLREQRKWLDNLHLQSDDLAAVLVCDKQLTIEKLQSLKTLIELMGF